MAYRHLTVADRIAIVTRRLHQFESEHYANVLARRALAEATDVSPEERAAMLEEMDAKIATLEAAMAVHAREHDELQAADGGPPAA